MFEILQTSSGNLLHIRATGRLAHADRELLIPRLEAWIAEHQSTSCYMELAAFDGIEIGAFSNEVPLDIHRGKEIQRCAIVGNHAWTQCMTRVARSLFPEAEVRYFDAIRDQKALDWIHEASENPLVPA